jgi:hypothetical protein
MLRGKLTSLRPHTAMSETMHLRHGHLSAHAGPLSHWERAGVWERSLAHIFDKTFGVNRAFNAAVFVAPPHPVAMELDLFGERRSSHWVKGGGVSKRELLVG